MGQGTAKQTQACDRRGHRVAVQTVVGAGRRLSVAEFVGELERVTGLTCRCVWHAIASDPEFASSSRGAFLHNTTEMRPKMRELMAAIRDTDLLDALRSVYEQPTGACVVDPSAGFVDLEVAMGAPGDEDGDDVSLPAVIYRFPPW